MGLEDALEQLVNRPDSVDTERHTVTNDLASLDNIKVEELRGMDAAEVKVEAKVEVKAEAVDSSCSGVAMDTDSGDADNIDVKPSSSVDSGFGSVTSPPASVPPPKVTPRKGQSVCCL